MKALKILIGLIVLVVIAVVVIGMLFLNNINQLTVDTVQDQGSQLLKTEVKLQAANIELTKGKGSLQNLTVANPSGFSQANALEMGAVTLQIDPESLLGDVKVIKEISVDGARLLAEQKNLKDTNLQALLDNIQQSAGPTEDTAPAEPGPEVRLMVEKFRFTNGQLNLKSAQFGERTINLPTIALDNIGDKTTGLTPEQLGQAVVAPLLEQVKAAVTKELTELAKDKAEEKLKEKLKEKLSDKIGGEAVDKLKSIFGR
ncbi:AsmA family protein [Pseudoteredinibacter isoporae]|uniref:AsmA family protein n=1 Tax=Pseudoteredinibacter isoporae TaxID=570281 RepID=UPI0031092060